MYWNLIVFFVRLVIQRIFYFLILKILKLDVTNAALAVLKRHSALGLYSGLSY